MGIVTINVVLTPALSIQYEKPLNNCRYIFPSKVKDKVHGLRLRHSLTTDSHCPGDVGLLVGPVRNSGGTFGTRGEFAVCTAARCWALIKSRCRSFSRFAAAPPVSLLIPLRIIDSRDEDPSVTLRP